MMKSTWNLAQSLTTRYHDRTDKQISGAWLPDVSSPKNPGSCKSVSNSGFWNMETQKASLKNRVCKQV